MRKRPGIAGGKNIERSCCSECCFYNTQHPKKHAKKGHWYKGGLLKQLRPFCGYRRRLGPRESVSTQNIRLRGCTEAFSSYKVWELVTDLGWLLGENIVGKRTRAQASCPHYIAYNINKCQAGTISKLKGGQKCPFGGWFGVLPNDVPNIADGVRVLARAGAADNGTPRSTGLTIGRIFPSRVGRYSPQ